MDPATTAAPAAAPDPGKPDAILVPRAWVAPGAKYAADWPARLDFLRPILGSPMHRRAQGDVWFFTADITQTLLFPTDHPLAGRPRYAWVPQQNGLTYGFLVPEAKD